MAEVWKDPSKYQPSNIIGHADLKAGNACLKPENVVDRCLQNPPSNSNASDTWPTSSYLVY